MSLSNFSICALIVAMCGASLLERYMVRKISYKTVHNQIRIFGQIKEPKGSKPTPTGGTPPVTKSTSNKLNLEPKVKEDTWLHEPIRITQKRIKSYEYLWEYD